MVDTSLIKQQLKMPKHYFNTFGNIKYVFSNLEKFKYLSFTTQTLKPPITVSFISLLILKT